IVALLALHEAGIVEEARHAVGRQRALGHPGLDLLEIELEPLGLLLRQQRIEMAEPFDETAVARRTRVGDHDVVDRTLLGAGASEADLQGHSSFPFVGYFVLARTCVISSSPILAGRAAWD